MLSESRIREYLDYASCYDQFNELTPNGTPADPPSMGSPMSDMRRASIMAYKRVLGELSEKQITEAMELFDCPILKAWDSEYMAGRKFSYPVN